MNTRALALCACLFFAVSFAQQATQLQYTVGQNYVYVVSGVVQNNGYVVNTAESTQGYYSMMASTLVMQPIAENATCYEFIMNLFDTVVSVNNTNQVSQSFEASGSLGYDVYFIQEKTGQVLEITYDSDDSEYYLNIKVSVINGLQTSVIGAGQTEVVSESDPVGVHTSTIVGSAGDNNALFLVKTFTQADFSLFSDPNLQASNVALSAQASVTLDPTGYVVSAGLTQSVTFTDAAPQPPSIKKNVNAFDNTTGFNMDLSSSGTLTFTYSAPSAYATTTFTNKPVKAVSNDMFSFSTVAVQASAIRALTLLNFADQLKVAMVEKTDINLLNKVGKHIQVNAQDAELMIPYMSDAALADVNTRDRVFFVISVAQHEGLLLKYGLFSQDCAVRMRAVLAAVYFKNPSNQLKAVILRLSNDNSCGSDVSHIASNIVRKNLIGKEQEIFASLFPYNVSVSKDITLGGSIAGVTITADLFAGTNLDCSQSTFNYEVFAEVTATASLFGYTQQALDATIVYGQVGATPLSNALTVYVWGDLIYNQPISVIDCQIHTYPLVHTAPGFNLAYTVWVSIIPVSFSAAASLNLNLDWGWDLCTTSLTADVEANADAAITYTGSSYTDLLVLRAGFDISASFNTALVPQADVDGTLCQIELVVDVSEQPMDASVTSYYQWRECKFLFFDCHWGNHDQQVWWQWDAPAKNYTLFQQTYKIASE